MSRLPSKGYLRSLGDPRVHPNGFIQLDLTRNQRMHVWHPRLPYRQKTYHPVHDHVFGFTSRIFSGMLVHVVYSLLTADHGTHLMWEAKCTDDEESVLRPAVAGEPVVLTNGFAQAFWPGEEYTLLPFGFHESLAGVPTMTVMDKHDKTIHRGNPARPRIAVPVGVEPDNDFRRDAVDADVLWELIEEAYPS